MLKMESGTNSAEHPLGHLANTICPERATQNSIVEPFQGSYSDGISTWGGVHPHSRILLPQADMREPFRLSRSTHIVDQRQHI